MCRFKLTNKTYPTKCGPSGMGRRTFWRQRELNFLLIQLYKRSHTAYDWSDISGIIWRRTIDMWQWNYFLFANQLIRLLISLHFVYLCRACVCVCCAILCVIWKQQIDHRIEHQGKTNSGTQMIVATEANIVDCLCELCMSIEQP